MIGAILGALLGLILCLQVVLLRQTRANTAVVPSVDRPLLMPDVEQLAAEASERIAAVERQSMERIAAMRAIAFQKEADWIQGTRAQAMADALKVPFCIPDTTAHIFTSVNETFAHMLGYEVADMTGRPWADFMAPEITAALRAQADAHQEDVNAGKAASGVFECVYIARSGDRVAITWDGVGLMPGGGPAFFLGRT